MDEIDDFDTGRKSITEEAVDKVKGLWNKVQGRHGPDDIVDYRYSYTVFFFLLFPGTFSLSISIIIAFDVTNSSPIIMYFCIRYL